MLGTATAIDNPARQAFVKEMVGPEDVPNAVALNSIVMNTARLVGPALGGITIAAVGVSGCFTINAVSFLAVIGGLLLMRPERFYEIPNPPRGKMLTQIAEGLRYVVHTPDIALVMLLMGVLGTFGYNFTVLLPLIAQYVLHSGPIGFGALTSAMAVGSLIAALGIAYSGRVTQRTLLTGAAGFSVLLLCLALSNAWVVTIGVLVALGVFSIVFTATANSRLQILTPPQLRGRVMSLYTMLFLGSTPIGAWCLAPSPSTRASRSRWGKSPCSAASAPLPGCSISVINGRSSPRARPKSAPRDMAACLLWLHHHFIDIAPQPVLTGLEGLHNRMTRLVEVLGGVLVLR